MTHTLLAGVGLTHVRVYATPSPGERCGGTPHAHLAGSEIYIGMSGTGALESIDATGHHRHVLAPGHAVQIGPGVVRRLVNDDSLEVLVLAESQAFDDADAVFAFPDEDLIDPDAYTELSSSSDITRITRRRDRAVTGFRHLVHAWHEHPEKGRQALERFHERAVQIVAPWARSWLTRPDVVSGQLADRVRALADGAATYLADTAAFPLAALDRDRLTPRLDGWEWSYQPRS